MKYGNFGILAALLGAVNAGCGAPLFSSITAYRDAFCILEATTLNSGENNLQLLLAINQAYAPFVRKCQYLKSYELSQKLDCTGSGRSRKTETSYYATEDCSGPPKSFVVGPYQDITFGKCMKFGENYFFKITEYDAVTDDETRNTTINAQLEWNYDTMMTYCLNIGNFYQPECIKGWYYVMDNDWVSAVWISLLQFALNQTLFISAGWWLLPPCTFMTGLLLLIFPDLSPNIDNAPYPSFTSFLIALVVIQVNLMKWDWYLWANLFNTFNMSTLDPINWGWPWIPLWLILETWWILWWATPMAFAFNIWWSFPLFLIASWYTYRGYLSVPYYQFTTEKDGSTSM